jgi:hypothetical protein
MKIDYIKDRLTNRQELVPKVLLGVAALCGILILIKITGFFMASARAENVVQRAIKQSGADPNNLEKHLASSTAITNELKENNLFAPSLAKQHPVSEVSGIFGDQVLIKDKWYNVGDKIADAKIVAIGPTSVTVAWEGREKTFLPIQAKIAEAPGGPRSKGAVANAKEGEDGSTKEGGPEAVTVRIEGERPEFFGGRGGPGEGFMAIRERFGNMSEEERQAFREQMRERFSRGRGGPGGGMDFARRGGQGGRGPGGR